MVGRLHALGLAAVAWVGVCLGAHADEVEDVPERDFSWSAVVGEGPSGYQQALEEGDLHVVHAVRSFERDHGGRIQRAIRAYEHAAKLRPREPEPHYRLAQLYYTFFISNRDGVVPAAEVTQQALRHWDRFEELAPLDPRVPDVLFERSLALTKQANDDAFRAAVAVYDRILGMTSPDTTDPNTISIYLGNKAELHMMLGQLDEAIETYNLAIDYSSGSWLGYGLAVALDRDGQGVKARQLMRLNLANDKQMQRISQDGTFFVPAGEKYYYQALGYEVLGDIERAVAFYQAFIESGAHPRFHARAREHLRRLTPGIGKGREGRSPRGRSAP